MRTLPEKPNNPNTPAQQTQRSKFGLITRFLSKINPVIRRGFKSDLKQQTEFSSALSYNIKKAVTGEVPDVQIDYSALMVTRGSLVPTVGSSASTDTPGEVTFSWTNNAGKGNARSEDQALMLLYNTDRGRALYVTEDGPTRKEETYTFHVPDAYAGETVEAYLGFVTADGEEASDSEYLGTLTLL
jgi:hypothetical protein